MIMKLLYTLLFIIAFTGTYTAEAQTETQPAKEEKLTSGPEYEKRYEKLKELHIKKLSSESYKNQRAVYRAFVKKMNYKGMNFFEISQNMLGWLKDNIKQTSFESYEAAEKEWAEVNAAIKASTEDNIEYYTYMRECLKCCGTEIAKQVMMDIREENPELFYGE